MLKLLSEFLRSPDDFFQDERRQRIVIISLFSLLFVCILFSMAKDAVRRRNAAQQPDISPAPIAPAPTQTKWWVSQEPSETATILLPNLQTPIVRTRTSVSSSKCPAYAADFRPGTFGYISLFPPYENFVRSGAGKSYSTLGFIEIGDWVKMLSEDKIGDFIQWLDAEQNARGWTDYRLAKEAKISFSILSRARNNGILPKWDACVAIAEAFRISPITVFRAARLLPPAPKDEEDTTRLDDWTHLLKDIDPEDERELRQIAEVKIKRRANEKFSKSLKSKKAT